VIFAPFRRFGCRFSGETLAIEDDAWFSTEDRGGKGGRETLLGGSCLEEAVDDAEEVESVDLEAEFLELDDFMKLKNGIRGI